MADWEPERQGRAVCGGRVLCLRSIWRKFIEKLAGLEKYKNFKFTTFFTTPATRFCDHTTKLSHTLAKPMHMGRALDPPISTHLFHLAHWSLAIPNANSAHEIIIATLVLQKDSTPVSCSCGTMFPIRRTSSGVICNTCISGYLFFMVSSAVASWHSPYDFFYNSCLKPTKDSGCVHWNQTDVLGIHIYNTTICGIIVYNFGNNRRYFNRLLLL